jgi:hypothetical protein
MNVSNKPPHLGARASGPRCTICGWNPSFPQAPRKHASQVRGPLARVGQASLALSPHLTLAGCAGRWPALDKHHSHFHRTSRWPGAQAAGPRWKSITCTFTAPHAGRVRGPLARVVRSAVGTHRFPRPPANTLAECAGLWPALYDLRLEPIVSPGPHSLLAPISSPTAPVRRMVGPSTMGQK